MTSRPDAVVSSSSATISEEIRRSSIIPHDDDDDEEDPIIRCIDVFISPELSRTLHLLQFPIQPAILSPPSSISNSDGYNSSCKEATTPIEAKFRPKHNMLELEFPIPKAALGDHSYKQADNIAHLTQRTFTSNSIAPATHVALAKLDKAGERLDVIPLQKNVLQMRPSFKHLHNHDNDEDNDAQANIDRAGDSTNSNARQKPILFQKKETERSATVRRNTYAYKRASEESEDWIELDIHGSHDGSKWPSTRKDVLRKVACANRAKTIKLAKTKLFSDHCDGGYVRSLNYMEPISSAFADEDMMMTTTTMMGGVAASSSSPPNNTAGDAGQIAELASKLVALLQEGDGTMIPYRVIRCNFHNDRVSDEMLIMALSSCAVLVRGNFALKSSLTKFLKNEVMKEMRDLMLLLLNMHGSLSRDRLIRTFDVKASTNGAYKVINADTVTFVLETIAKLSNGSWLSKVEDDVFFAARFPELASYHAVYWTKKKEMLNELVELYEK